MATTDRSSAEPDAGTGPATVARACRDAGFCQLLARADGDGLAAGALLASACDAVGTPYQLAVVRTDADAQARRSAADPETTTVGIGIEPGSDPGLVINPEDGALTLGAVRAVGALDAAPDPDPIVALAGAVAAGRAPGALGAGLLERADLSRRPGLAAPTADPVDGLAHTTLVHLPPSGSPETARDALGRLGIAPEADPATDGDAARRLASWVAITATDGDAPPRAADAVERALRPYVLPGPVRTLAGYADVLDACARRAPGLGVALATGRSVRESALETWRAHACDAHAAVRNAALERHPGLTVARLEGDAPVGTVARLCRDFRSPEPAVLAVAPGGTAGLATADAAAGDVIGPAADRVEGYAAGPTGVATGPADRADALVEAVREVLGA